MLNSPIKNRFKMIFGTMVLVWATLAIFSTILLLSIVWRGKMLFRLSIFWARVVTWGYGISTSLQGKEKIVPGVSYILVVNHGSYTDPLVLGTALAGTSLLFRWVVKREVLKIPMFGWGLSAMGAVGLDRSKNTSGLTLLQQARDLLIDGWGLVIYPEGTRTTARNGELMPFKRGTFMLAIRMGIPILPITINGTVKIMPRGTTLIRPGHVTVIAGDPIPTEDLGRKDISALMEKTVHAIRQNLDPGYDPFRGNPWPLPGIPGKNVRSTPR